MLSRAARALTDPADTPRPIIRCLKLVRFELSQLSHIEQQSQTFRARVYVSFCIEGGALDEDLSKQFDGFPVDEDGRPTNRPSAVWYLSQLQFHNGHDLRVLESKVAVVGNDLHLVQRLEGEFFERFELQAFPFDAQDLTVTLSFNCSISGNCPVELSCPSSASLSIDVTSFAFSDVWDLNPTLSHELSTVGACKMTRFPALRVRACACRRANFVLVNVAVPMGFISLVPATIFVVSVEETAEMLNIAVTVMLTAVAFKFVIAAYLPQISYLTLIDKYIQFCNAITYLSAVLVAIVGGLQNWVCAPTSAPAFCVRDGADFAHGLGLILHQAQTRSSALFTSQPVPDISRFPNLPLDLPRCRCHELAIAARLVRLSSSRRCRAGHRAGRLSRRQQGGGGGEEAEREGAHEKRTHTRREQRLPMLRLNLSHVATGEQEQSAQAEEVGAAEAPELRGGGYRPPSLQLSQPPQPPRQSAGEPALVAGAEPRPDASDEVEAHGRDCRGDGAARSDGTHPPSRQVANASSWCIF